jgi:hypothetical protein
MQYMGAGALFGFDNPLLRVRGCGTQQVAAKEQLTDEVSSTD